MTNIPTWHERAEAHPDGGQAMTDKIEEIRDRVEQDVAKGPANKELYRVHKDRAFLLAEVDRLRRHVDALQEKVSAESCACSYDSPDAVCLAHSPQLSAALADVDRLTRERNEARAWAAKLLATLEMVRDADNDCRVEGWATIPDAVRRSIDEALEAKP